MKKLLLTLSFLVVCLATLHAQPLIVLDNPDKVLVIGTSVAFFEDKEGKLPFTAILQPDI